ncbi:unnamed protein product [Prorocentrum cordatum]|uniref:JmjC domain-containing protein n=1 Tax=Prorocentrum cordatum TaxID=2364126 RepID=A0ABN9VR86_9DINO|nr:unnamed protein product [Polarella glacialis]
MPAWAFLEVGQLRRDILRERAKLPAGEPLRLERHPRLRERLNREVEVSLFFSTCPSCPWTCRPPTCTTSRRGLSDSASSCRCRSTSPTTPVRCPARCRRTSGLRAAKLAPEWGAPHSTRLWATNGAPWQQPYPPWNDAQAPTPSEDQWIYSCFHCDRMENLHSLLSGEKQVVLVPPGRKDVLKATRHSRQLQWLVAPVPTPSGGSYLGATHFESHLQKECTSAQSAVHPLRTEAENRRASGGAWPDEVDFPVWVGSLRPGDTLYIPAYWWHWVATATPPALGQFDAGALAMSVNFWWWPQHRDEEMERWCYQNEVENLQNARVPVPQDCHPLPREAHAEIFRRETLQMRLQASIPQPWPRFPEEYEAVD